MRRALVIFGLWVGLAAGGAAGAGGAAPADAGAAAAPVPPGAAPGRPAGLMELVRLALDDAPAIEAAVRRREAASGDERAALAGLLPQLELSGAYEAVRRDEEGRVDFDTRSFERSQFQLRFTQPLYAPAAAREHARQRSATREAETHIRVEHQRTIRQVAEAYYDALAAREALRLSEEEVEALRGERGRITALRERGRASASEVQELEASLSSARADRLDAAHELDSALEILRERIGREVPDLARPERLELEGSLVGDLAHWQEQARSQSPRLVNRRQSVVTQRRAVRTARAGHLPTLDLVAYQQRFDDFDEDVGAGLAEPTPGREFVDNVIGLNLTVPLYMGGRVRAETRAAEARVGERQAELHTEHREVEREVRTAHSLMRRTERSMEMRREALEAQNARVEAIEEEVAAGRRPAVAAINAQRDRFRARRALLDAQTRHLQAFVRLEAAAGVLDVPTLERLDAMLLQ